MDPYTAEIIATQAAIDAPPMTLELRAWISFAIFLAVLLFVVWMLEDE